MSKLRIFSYPFLLSDSLHPENPRLPLNEEVYGDLKLQFPNEPHELILPQMPVKTDH